MKDQIAWVIKHPADYLMIYTMGKNENECIYSYALGGLFPHLKWEEIQKKGFSCVRVLIEEVVG